MRFTLMSLLLLSFSVVANDQEKTPSQFSISQYKPKAVGEARSLKGGSFLYREFYLCTEQERACVVEYRDANDVIFAYKNVDYSGSMHAPNLDFTDFRNGTEHVATGPFDADTVVDAGFDNYVRQNWQALNKGKAIPLSFLVMARNSPLSMELERDTEKPCEATQLCLQVSPTSWLISKVLSPIELDYDRNTRLLMAYRGISNLPDESGDRKLVEIRYQYEAEVTEASEKSR